MASAPIVRWLVVAVGLAVAASCGSTVADEPTVIHDAVVTLIEQAEVPARAIGPLAEVTVREGDIVGKDAFLAKIDDAEAQLAADRAEIELAVARRESKNELPILAVTKAAEAARAELKRATESAAKYEKSISQSELDRLRLSADEADYKQRQAVHVRETADLTARIKENELATIRHRQQLHQIKSPIAGVVVEVKRRRGEWVEPGASVVRVMRLDRLRVEAFCHAKELSKVAVGGAIRLQMPEMDGSSIEYSGHITFVSPEVNPVNGQVRIWAEVANDDGALRPGMSGSLILAPAEKAAAVTKPRRGP